MQTIFYRTVNLIIDIGNTFVKMVCCDGHIIEEQRVTLSEQEAIRAFCRKYPFEGGIYCSVVDLPEELEHEWSCLPFPMLHYQSGITPVPLKSSYLTPRTLGADRMAASVGAWAQWPGRNVLIIDVGTCATYDFISADGEYLGGNISPGPMMRLKALHQFTGKLPLVAYEGERPEFGNNTETAIRCGVLTGMRMEIEGYITRYAQEFERLLVCMTGGDAINLDTAVADIHYDRYLVPKGLNEILRWNQQAAVAQSLNKNN